MQPKWANHWKAADSGLSDPRENQPRKQVRKRKKESEKGASSQRTYQLDQTLFGAYFCVFGSFYEGFLQKGDKSN
jgi:hypothetical protein